MFEYCKNCKNHDDCYNNNWCVTMDRGRKIEGEYICDNFEPTLNSKIIFLRDIVRLQHYYIEIFEEEDSDYVNYRKTGQLYRRVSETLSKITDIEEDRAKIYDIIGHGSWHNKDRTFKPICDDIRKLGYKVVERMIEQHIKNLEKYIKEDNALIEKDGSDFAEYCKNHCEDIQAIIDDWKLKEKIINKMAYCIENYQICDYEITDYTYRMCENIPDDVNPPCLKCIKNYFYKEAENEK